MLVGDPTRARREYHATARAALAAAHPGLRFRPVDRLEARRDTPAGELEAVRELAA
jgi:AMMECR1 domain-containing protein